VKVSPPRRPPPADMPEVSHSLMEHSPLPMAELDGAGHIVRYVNPAFCRLIGKSKEALVGNPFAATAQEGDKCLTVLDRVYRTGEAETHTEPEHPGSHPVYWSYAMWPVLGPDRHPAAVMMQVTETTRFHQQAAAMNEALVLSSVRQHELTEGAEKLNERIGRLLEELTHRVKNSLQFIAAMVMIESRSHKSGEGRAALERVSHRITALGQLYTKLTDSNTVEAVDAAP
jgi:PAS domain S-box-containing protein